MRQHDHRYRGVRAGPAGIVSVDGRPLPVTARAARLAPAGFAWGSQTNGALALAHALLAYELGAQLADDLYASFEQEVIADLPRDRGGEAWTLTSQQIRDWWTTRRLLAQVLAALEANDK